MKIQCIAIDDEPLALKQLAEYIKKTAFLELAGQFTSTFQASEALKHLSVDLMFVDVNMPDLNGIDFVKSLDDPPMIVFVTAYSHYAIEGFRVQAIDYLLKPIGYTEFLTSASKAKTHFDTILSDSIKENNDKDYLFVKSDSKIVQISLTDIIYIEGMREYVRIHLTNGKPLMPLMSMRVLAEQLPAGIFMRVHRSYIVNLRKIITIDHSMLVVTNNILIPVSEQYKETFREYINSHSLG